MINEGQFSDLVVALMEQTLSQAPAEMRELITPHVEAKLQKLVRTQLFHFMGKLDDKQKRLFGFHTSALEKLYFLLTNFLFL